MHAHWLVFDIDPTVPIIKQSRNQLQGILVAGFCNEKNWWLHAKVDKSFGTWYLVGNHVHCNKLSTRKNIDGDNPMTWITLVPNSTINRSDFKREMELALDRYLERSSF